MSPDGKKVSFLQMHASGFPIASVYDLADGKLTIVLASTADEFDLSHCSWASHERILCSFQGVDTVRRKHYPVTRLVAVDADGRNQKVLMQGLLRGLWAQFQDQIIDYLPDDPRRVLIAMPDGSGTGVSTLDIYSGNVRRVVRPRKFVRRWISDGHGTPRLRFFQSENRTRWQSRLAGKKSWHELREPDSGTYNPIGFGAELDELLVLKSKNGRMALYAEDLANDQAETMIYAHPTVDIDRFKQLGKYQRLVGVGYVTDMPHVHYFDSTLENVADRLEHALPNQVIRFIDETWDRKRYWIHASSDRNPGAYYVLDAPTNNVQHVTDTHARLKGRQLAAMQPIRYAAEDGSQVPGYLTLPPSRADEPLPTIILPHGGPESRDEWGFDFLPQFLAASGYAVLQSNYRGSGGYGEDWAGTGGFIAWRLAMSDLEAGARALVERGVADPARICIVGWSYGGYAALMSALEYPERYRCAVSIAGVSDPKSLRNEWDRFVGGDEFGDSLIGNDDDVIERGSPRRRAAEMTVPVLLFHGDEDINVHSDHSKKLVKALKKKKKSVEYHVYEDAEHDIWRSEYRIDMLQKMGSFLERNLAADTAEPAPAASAPE
jgi:dipeptidyl aminopeptidase/acylaminoacyl peptidase